MNRYSHSQLATIAYAVLAGLSLFRVLVVRGLVAEAAWGLLYFGASTALLALLLAWISRRFASQGSKPPTLIVFPVHDPADRPARKAA